MREAGDDDMDVEDWRGDGGHEKAEKAHQARGDGCEGGGPAHHGVHPAEEEAPHRTETATQVGVFAAGFGKHGAELRERERAEKGKNGADDPGGEDDGDGTAFARHFGGLEENSGADHGADYDGHGGPGAESAD